MSRTEPATPYTVRLLDPSTWDVFAELVERNNGIFGGCWCIGYHPECGQRGISHRLVKEQRVRSGAAHAALVVDREGRAQGWAQYGSVDELSGIKHRRAYDKDPPPLPDWRITCIYVDPRHRGQGVARLALEGALDEIARQGGGLVEAISEVTDGRIAHGRFLFSGTVELFDQYDFDRVRQVGKHAWIVHRVVQASRSQPHTSAGGTTTRTPHTVPAICARSGASAGQLPTKMYPDTPPPPS